MTVAARFPASITRQQLATIRSHDPSGFMRKSNAAAKFAAIGIDMSDVRYLEGGREGDPALILGVWSGPGLQDVAEVTIPIVD